MCFLTRQVSVPPAGCHVGDSVAGGVLISSFVMRVLKWQLSHLCPPDRGLLMGQKTCLLMAAAASLELCRKSLLPDQVHHPLPRPPHLASSSCTWMEVHQEQQRREVTNIARASVGVFTRFPPSLTRMRTLDGNSESRMCTFECALVAGAVPLPLLGAAKVPLSKAALPEQRRMAAPCF